MCERTYCRHEHERLCSCPPVTCRDALGMAAHLAENMEQVQWSLTYNSLKDMLDDARKRARELLQLVGLEPSAFDRYPNQFSGGQRQRIGIARLALRRYDLIIADEITASLDPDTSGQVMGNLLALPCMVVAITHDISGAFMKQFDKVYRVEHGSVTQA